MILFRSLALLSLIALCLEANVSAQTSSLQFQPPVQYQQAAQQQQQRVQQIPIQQQPTLAQPMQAPLFGTQGGLTVYQQNPNHPQPAMQPVVPQTQMGQPNMGQPNMGQPNMGQPNMGQPPIRVATSNPGQSAIPAAGGQPISLYDGGTNRMPQTVPPAVQGIPPGIPQGMEHIGRAEPINRIIPFFPTPEEQRELDMFLARWEQYSNQINRYEVDFNLFIHDPTIPGAEQNVPHKIAYGYFKYISKPRRFVYAVEGEWVDKKKVKRDGDKNPQIFAEKIIIDDKSVHQYDYNAKTVRQINVPAELTGKGIADSPLPLIFGAKADDLKRRFSMKIENISDDVVRLFARPLLIEDQQEFKELEVLIHRNTLTAQALRQWDPNGKTYKAFELRAPVVNPNTLFPIAQILKEWFTPDVPPGWKRDERDWLATPPPATAMQQPRIAHPAHETPLYRSSSGFPPSQE